MVHGGTSICATASVPKGVAIPRCTHTDLENFYIPVTCGAQKAAAFLGEEPMENMLALLGREASIFSDER